MLPQLSQLALASIALLASSCTFHSHTSQMSGVNGIRGEPIEYQTTTNVGLNALFVIPLLGETSAGATVESFAEEASNRGATRMRIMDSKSSTYWLVFPPISFFIHPVTTTIEGELEGTVVR